MVMSAQLGSQPCLKKTTQTTIRKTVYDMFSACLCADFTALVLQNVTTYPPPQPIHC